MNLAKAPSLSASLAALLLSGCLVGCNNEHGNSTSSEEGTTAPPTTPTTGANTELSTAFPLHTTVFGIPIRGASGTSTEVMLHAAKVMAQYLDNNEDGIPDNQAIVDYMVTQEATLLMAKNSTDFESAAKKLEEKDTYQDLLGDEVKPNGAENGEFDATLEEVLHLITHVGYAGVYPEVFGEAIDSSIADAMDIARGGRFETIPDSYPDNAWYTYDDESCKYDCMVTEYTYWTLTSILGAQVFSGREEEIADEWKLNTRDKVEMQDSAAYAILTNASYGLATVLPDGNYTAKEFTIEGADNNAGGDSGGNDGSHEILQSALAANSGYKVAFGDTKKIWMMNPDGSDVTELADGNPISGYVSWGPEAKYVYFTSAKGPNESAWEAFRVNVETNQLTQLSLFEEDVRSLGVSPDGMYLAISIMNGNSNIGDNNDNLTQFHTDLYIMEMSTAQDIWAEDNKITKAHMSLLVSSPASEQFWYEELNWSPKVSKDDGLPVLAYTKTWRYDEDDVSYTHVYTIKADGSDNKLIAENKDQPIFDFDGQRLTFLDLSYFDFSDQTLHQLFVTEINNEVSGPAISPDGGFIIFEVGDENRKAGMARVSESDNNQGVIIGDINVYEPRWSPVPINQ